MLFNIKTKKTAAYLFQNKSTTLQNKVFKYIKVK